MRKTLCIVIGLTIAATAASAANGQAPSPIQRIIAQEKAQAAAKAAAAHRLQVSPPLMDGRSPDTRDAALTARAGTYGPPDGWYGRAVSLTQATRNTSVLDGRSPDTRDAVLANHDTTALPVVVVGGSGFDWTDAGIGTAAVFAFFLLAAGGLTLMRDARRQKVHG